MKLRDLLNTIKDVSVKYNTSVPMICGGVVRDKYLGKLENISDLDLTTGDKSVHLLAQETFLTLKKDFVVTSKTADDGHTSIYLGNLKVDFSSNFNVPGIDKILFQKGIKNPTAMQKEVFSRDFTCNSLLMTTDLHKIIDVTERGTDDLNKKIISTCLSPDVTLTANKNRVVRSIYLACKLQFDVDPQIISYVKSHPESIKTSNPKTLAEKLNSAFEKDSDRAGYLLTKMSLWSHVPILPSMYKQYNEHVKGTSDV